VWDIVGGQCAFIAESHEKQTAGRMLHPFLSIFIRHFYVSSRGSVPAAKEF
jgi:hypothetical protein